MIAGREIFFKTNLNKNSEIPVYLQLYNYLKYLIANHDIRLGDAFPSESEFCKQFDISRTTVRLALAELEKDNLVVRMKGKGTFVSEPKLNRTLNNLYSFSGEMKNLGLKTEAKVLSFDIIKADDQKRQIFSISDDADDRLFKIVRLRIVEDAPLSYETVYLPHSICPILTKELVETTSLYSILHQYSNIIPTRASEVYSSVNLTRPIAKLLGCRTGTSAFFVDRVSYDIHEEVFEIAHIYVRGDRCCYEVDLKTNNVSFLRQVDKQS